MKKLLLFMIACTLGLFGTVRAQETVLIGDEVNAEINSSIPFDIWSSTNICQQVYTADEINHSAGVINSLAVKFWGECIGGGCTETSTPNDNSFERKVAVYINNTELANMPQNGQNVPSGQVANFDGTVAFADGEWTEFVFTNPFQYEGGNIMVTMYDYTGGTAGSEYYYFYVNTIEGASKTSFKNSYPDTPFDIQESNNAFQNSSSRNIIKLTFGAAGEGGETPEQPEEPSTQESVVVTIDGTVGEYVANASNELPFNTNYHYTTSQQIYLAEELGIANGSTITNVAFNVKTTLQTQERTIKIYMVNTETSRYLNNYPILVSESDLVYDGTITIDANEKWYDLKLDNAFAYTGNNILLCVYDYTGVDTGKNTTFNTYNAKVKDAEDNFIIRSVYKRANGSFDPTLESTSTTSFSSGGSLPQVQFTCTTSGEGGEEPETPVAPAAPVVAATATETTITLTWEAVENATSYNIYTPSSFSSNVLGLTETTYTFENLTAGEYCFQVSAVNDVDESDATEVCATIEAPVVEEPETPVVDLTKQYRVKATSLDKYLYVLNNDAHVSGPNGGVVVYQTVNDDAQLFTLEDAGDGAYYFKSATGYYLYCQSWNVDAYSTTAKTALKMVDQGDGTFRLQNTNNDKYFKVEQVGMFYYPFCDCDGTNCTIATWTLEAVETPETPVDPEPEEPEQPEGEISIVEVGADKSPNTYNNYNLPVYDYNAYSVSQQIYPASDLGLVGDIHSIAFKLGNTTSAVTRQYEVYLSTTALTSYSDYNFIAVTEADKVFDGDVEISGAVDSWFTINFDKVFPYSGGNIVLTVYDKTGVALGNSGYHTFYKYNTVGMNALNKKASTPYDMSNMGTGGGFYYVNQIQLGMEVDPTPTAPQNVVATATSSSEIALTWGTIVVADSYNVYYGTELLGNVTETSCTILDLEPATEYCFTVTSVNELGESAASEVACATTKMLAPATPTGLAVTAVGEMSITLAWEASATAESYKVYQGENLVATNVTETTYTVEGLASETEYCFTVKAVNNGGESAATEAVCGTTTEFTGCYITFTLTDSYGDGWNYNKLTVAYGSSSQDLTFSSGKSATIVLPIPQDAVVTLTYVRYGQYSYPQENGFVVAYESGKEILRVDEGALSETVTFDAFTVNCGPEAPDAPVVTATALDATTIVLAMESFGAEKYNIYQGEELIASVTETTYTVEGLEANTEYCYSVTAENELGVSAATEVCATTKMYAPAAPANLVATTTGCFSIALTWDASATAESYNVYQGENLLATVTETAYTAEGLTHDTEYCFTVKAVNNGGESEASEAVCATTEEYDGCFVNFTLTDKYNDSWDGCYLVVAYEGVSEQLDCPSTESPKTYTLGIPQGTEVTVTYTKNSNYPGEKAFTITYESGKEILAVAEGTLTETTNWTFVVDCTPEVPGIVTVAAEAIGDETIVLTMNAVGAESYNIYLGEELVATTTEKVYAVEGLEPETEYCFTVEAVNEVGKSEELSEACATTYKEGTSVVQIGEGTENYVSTSPVNEFYSYSISQTVYTAEEIGFGAGVIKSVSYNQYTGGNNTRNISVFMKNVGEDVNLGTAWEELTEDMLVYDGEFTFGTTGWTEIKLQEDFVYEGGNLLVSVLDKTGAYAYNYDMFYTYLTGNMTVRAIYAGMGQEIDPYNINLSKQSLYNNNYSLVAPQVKLVIEPVASEEPVAPAAPANVAATATESTVTLTWEAVENALSYNVYQGEDVIATVTELTYTVEGLNPYAEYCFQVSAVGEGGESDATEVCATTLDLTIAAPVVTAEAAETTVTLTWEAVENALSYNVYQGEDVIATVTELTYTVEGLTEGTEYTFAVSAVRNAQELTSEVVTVTTLVPAPVAKDYRLESVETSYSATAYVYDEELTNKVVAIDEEGLVTVVSYNEEGQIEKAVASYEDVDEEGNPIETVLSSVEYAYDENGVWVGYTEFAQGWFGPITNETVFTYDAEGRLVSLASDASGLVQELSYNEAGLLSQVLEGYMIGGDDEEETEEEGEDNDEIEALSFELSYESKITFEYDTEGRLVKKNYYYYDMYETMEFYLAESEVYEYDENGNCATKKVYLAETEDEEGNLTLNSFPYNVVEYFYDLTINNEDVYSFEYPHFAFINWVEPSYVNILTKELSYYSYYDYDLGEVVSHSYEATVYNYNPEVLSAPFAPMNLSAEVLSAESVELTWAGFADAESFTIYSADTVYAEGLVDPYYTIEGLEIGVEYCFEVVAVNTVGTSEASNTACVTIELPAAPANLVAEATSQTTIDLTWGAVEGIWIYNVYEVVEVEGETTYELVEEEVWGTYYTVEDLEAETEYSFVVKAVNNVGESEASNVATATTLAPPAPTVPAAPVVEGSFEGDIVHLVWEPVEGALYYSLYYEGSLIDSEFEDSAVDIRVPSAGTYCFTVTASNEIGESEHSNKVCVTVTVPEDMVAPEAPVLEATLDEDYVVLTWEAVEGATFYDVYIETSSGQGQYLGTATMEDLPIRMQLPEHGVYCFYVIAANIAGESEPSNTACVNYGGVGVEENEFALNIYPNPASDRVVIETEANIESVAIYTLTGVMVYSEVDFNDNTINVSDFASGVYIMKVRTENGESVQRFIKK